MELHFIKNDLRFSFGKMFVSLEKRKLLKPEFVYIGAELMKPCLGSRARNLVLFCFYFSSTVIAEDFCYCQWKIQITVALILTMKI